MAEKLSEEEALEKESDKEVEIVSDKNSEDHATDPDLIPTDEAKENSTEESILCLVALRS